MCARGSEFDLKCEVGKVGLTDLFFGGGVILAATIETGTSPISLIPVQILNLGESPDVNPASGEARVLR